MPVNVIRELLVSLGVNVTPRTKQELRQYNQQISKLKGQMEDVADVAVRMGTALVGALVGAATAAGLVSQQVGHEAEQIERGALGLNLTRQEYQELMHVVRTFGVDGRELADAFLQINEASNRALNGSTEMVAALAGIGLEARQLKGLNPAQLFELIADHASRATDRSAALATMSRLLGEEASRKLGPAMMQGAGAIRALREEAHTLGVVMDDDALRTAKQVQLEWRRLTSIARGLRNELGVALAPAVTRVLRGFSDWVKVNREWLAGRLDGMVRTLTTAWEVLDFAVRGVGGWDVVFANVAGGAGIALLLLNWRKVEATLAVVKVLTTSITTLWGLLAGATGVTLAPVLAVLAGFVFFLGLAVLGIQDLWVWWQGGTSVLGTNLDMLERFIPVFGAVRELVNALAYAYVQLGHSVHGYIWALWNGLRPVMQWFEIALGPLIRRFEKLDTLWRRLNEGPSAFLRGVAGDVRDWTASNSTGNALGAMRLQQSVTGSVQGAVDRAAVGVDRLDRMMPGGPGVTVNQSNTFMGGRGWEVDDSLASAYRRAQLSVAGGAR